MGDNLSDLFDDPDFGHADFTGATSPEDLFSILESLEEATKDIIAPFSSFVAGKNDEPSAGAGLVDPASTPSTAKPRNETGAADDDGGDDDDDDASEPRKRRKLMLVEAVQYGQNKVSHITVERNRRKQMNEHLTVLRSLMPCFYVKRGDQASIIGGVVDYIKELQQLLQSLESKKQRKAYSEGLSPRTATSPRPPPPSPRPSPLSPRPSPLSPRVGLPISPRTPQPGSPYKPRAQPAAYLSPTMPPPYSESPPSFDGGGGDLAANSKSPIADVEVKFSGPNVLLKTASHRIPGQALKIITALEGLSLEILHVSISAIDETMLYSFTIKIGIECELSAEELAQEIQQTFS